MLQSRTQSLLAKRKALNAASAPAVGKITPLQPKISPSAAPPVEAAAAAAIAGASIGSTGSLTLLGNIIGFFFYTSATLFIIFLILVFIHFTIAPVFQTDQGGFIPIGNISTIQAYQKAPATPTDSVDTTMTSYDFTLQTTVLISSNYSSTVAPRVLFYRNDSVVTLPTSAKVNDLPTLFNKTNLLAYINNQNNSLNVIIYTLDKNGTYIANTVPPIDTVPVGTPFNLTIVFQQHFMEIYIDGKLQATKTFTGIPMDCKKKLFGPPESVKNLVQIGKLSFTPLILTATQIRNAVVPVGADFFKTS